MTINAITDPMEFASELEERERANAIAAHAAKLKPEQVRDAAGNWETEDCIDCGEPIGEARLQMGKVRCIECQEQLEDRRKRGLR